MARLVFKNLQREVLGFADAGDTIHFTKSSVIVSEVYGIYQLDTATDSRFILDGRIMAGQFAFVSDAEATSVTIGSTGAISGLNGLRLDGHDASVVNRGAITVSNEGISLYGVGGSAVNDGTIVAAYGFYLDGGSAFFVNGEHGRIEAINEAMLSFGDAGDKVVFVNHGTAVVSQGGLAVQGWDENNTVINDGTMVGDIDLGGGFNVVDLRGGTYKGIIHGGPDDDQLITDDARYQLVEYSGGGFDSVISSVSYTLSDNVEQLRLGGAKSIAGTGNASDNMLFGNRAANRLDGLDGDDRLNGGGGDDILSGGDGRDIFVFGKDHGNDTVEDFIPGYERLDVFQWLDTSDFEEIMSHIRDVDGSAVIRFDGQSVTLVDVQKIDLGSMDFGII